MQNRHSALALAFCFASLLAACVVYWPGLSGGFALDDYTNIVQNAALRVGSLSWDELSRAAFSFQAGPTMRPVSMLSFALNTYFFGTEAEAFKVVNLVIHLLNGLLVFILLLQMLQTYRRTWKPSLPEYRAEWLALTAGALWLLHPLNLMPVLYVVQRESSLSSLFVLLGCNTYIWGRTRQLQNRRGAWAIWTLVPLCTLVATVCKESGALLPVYTLVIECFIFRFRDADSRCDRQALLFYLPMLVLPLCAAALWIISSHGGPLDYSHRDFTLPERLLSETRILWLYISWTLFPDLSSMGLYHDDIAVSHGLLQPVTTLWAILGLIALAGACLSLWKRYPLAVMGIAWFFGGQLMESTIFPLELAYEHRCYLPDLGLILAAVSMVFPLAVGSRFERPRYALLASLLAGCAMLTWMRASDWSDNLRFSASEARHHPQSPYATYMLGQTYANRVLMENKDEYADAVNTLRTASEVPRSTVIPDVSLVLVQAQLKGRVDPDVLPRIARKVSDRKLSASDIQGLAALGECVDKGNCVVEPADMQAIFDSALANPYLVALRDTHANILVIYGNYTATSLHDVRKARELMVQAAALVPTEAQYQENIVTMDISLRDAALASHDLEGLKKLNYLGHLDPVIAELQGEIDAALPRPKATR